MAGDVTIGAVEDIILMPWGIKLPARIDTGAATTSLGVSDIKINGSIAEFSMPGEQQPNRIIRLPIIKMRHVRSSLGRQQRPVVEMTLCIGKRKMLVAVNLADRTGMEFPLVIGRNVIHKGFIVDVRHDRINPPRCPDAVAQ